MAYVVGEGCINCGACEAGCPVGAISEGEDKRVIDPDVCVMCELAKQLARYLQSQKSKLYIK